MTLAAVASKLWRLVLLSLALSLPARFSAVGAPSPAPDQGVAALFPEPNQVAADFPDEPERYVALNLLWDTLHAKAPDAQAASAGKSAYYQAAQAVRQKYTGLGSQAYEDFDKRNRHLSADPNFRRSVLEKYHLTAVPVEKSVTAGPAAPRRNTDVTDATIRRAFLIASPFMIVSLLAMLRLVKRAVWKASTRSAVSPPPMNTPAGLPALPESLRVVSVPNLQYSVDLLSALVFDKETTMHTHVQTSTSGGQVYTVGNEVHSTPVQTSTSVRTTQEDLVWVRSADNRETSWTFTGGTFKVRPGQIVSIITRRAPDGSAEFMLAYNHNTGQLEQLGGIANAHMASGGSAWLTATLVGSVGFAIAFGIILSIKPDSDVDAVGRALSPIVDWVMGAIVSAIVASGMVLKVKRTLSTRRNASFKSQYLPGFRQFLEQCTPALQKRFPLS